uniref:Uncharacterized protein n=1 Tax=Acrobeloides nanus TaxID=290746 RepID=A0A914DY68_9BILA
MYVLNPMIVLIGLILLFGTSSNTNSSSDYCNIWIRTFSIIDSFFTALFLIILTITACSRICYSSFLSKFSEKSQGLFGINLEFFECFLLGNMAIGGIVAYARYFVIMAQEALKEKKKTEKKEPEKRMEEKESKIEESKENLKKVFM